MIRVHCNVQPDAPSFLPKKKRKWGVIIISGLEILTNMPPPPPSKATPKPSQLLHAERQSKSNGQTWSIWNCRRNSILFLLSTTKFFFFFERLNNRYCPLNVHNGQRWILFIGLCVVMSFVSR